MIGPLQDWDPRAYATHARFVSDLGAPVVELLAPSTGERILDLGCGDGALTRLLRERGADVVAVDASPDMVAAARLLGLDARVVDATALAFDQEFDAVFSNAALHWIRPPERVIDGVVRALRPGGRFVGEFGGCGNVSAVCASLNAARTARGLPALAPWFFPSPEEYRALLEAAGLRVNRMELFPRPTPLPGHLLDWLRTFANPFLGDVAPEARAPLLAEAAGGLQAVLCSDGRWHVDYVRLRFAASLPGGAGG